jgi:hypothetical protein
VLACIFLLRAKDGAPSIGAPSAARMGARGVRD